MGQRFERRKVRRIIRARAKTKRRRDREIADFIRISGMERDRDALDEREREVSRE